MSTCQYEDEQKSKEVMVEFLRENMKVPIRPAPPPPVNQKFPPKSSTAWVDPVKDSRTKTPANVQKKKPPPRPPPPKFHASGKKSAPSRPSQLIADLFHRKSNVNSKAGDVHQIAKPADQQPDPNVVMLIDFSSPPSSPTLTTRSSSDALSVNSFGSDGVTQCSGSSGNASNVESGFEDDFDVFGITRKAENRPRDPWSPPAKPPEPKPPLSGKTNAWVAFPSPGAPKKMPPSMPTIIRSKADTARVAPKGESDGTDSLADVFKTTNFLGKTSIFEEEDLDSWSSDSPPMPTCPPPAPPPEVLKDLLVNDTGVQPHAIALYDYNGEQPEDLSFKRNDRVNLVRKIDENWYVGEVGGREGSVPANFVSVRVPLPGDSSAGAAGAAEGFAVALYAFRPETWDDLEFQEGAVVRVTHRIDRDWLYGECEGKWGQFPASFVDRVPENLPWRKTG